MRNRLEKEVIAPLKQWTCSFKAVQVSPAGAEPFTSQLLADLDAPFNQSLLDKPAAYLNGMSAQAQRFSAAFINGCVALGP